MPVVREHDSRAAEFVALLQDPARPPIAARDVAVIVAHPDDETVGCGALLRRLKGAVVVIVTDGSPQNLHEAQRHGCSTVPGYAATRTRELKRAMQLAGVSLHSLVQLNIPDQQAAMRLGEITRRLLQLFATRGTRIAITHAYEGGHPDHDAAAFGVHRAAARSSNPVTIVEMPFYRAGGNGELRQSFVAWEAGHPVAVALNPDERALKQRMRDAYETQKEALCAFSLESEQFRLAPRYDFSVLPNGGDLLYEQHNWGMTPAQWLACVRAALAEEGWQP